MQILEWLGEHNHSGQLPSIMLNEVLLPLDHEKGFFAGDERNTLHMESQREDVATL